MIRVKLSEKREAVHRERTCNKDLSTYGSYIIQISYCYLYKLYIIVFIIFVHKAVNEVISM